MNLRRVIKRLATPMSVAGFVLGLGVSAVSAQVMSSADGRVVGYAAPAAASQLSSADLANAKPRMPMLTDLSQVPGGAGVAAQAYGTGSHPFTTRGAYTNATNGVPATGHPYRQTGKLWMRFGSSWYVCTASVIDKGLLVTAAHCVWNYGQPTGYADEVYFEPARHGTVAPYALKYGTWTASNWWVPTVYANGTDTCTVVGIVCANDVAVVVLNTGGLTGAHVGDVVGRYFPYENDQGYTSFLGAMSAQLTQLGYPVAFDSGYKMIRTDSLGYQADPFNVIIGSDQTGGSSGGPWIQNFGVAPTSTSSTPSFNGPNRVSAVTSWGYVSSLIKVQGASRFANNPAFPAPGNTNIRALLSAACGSSPGNCY